MLGSVSKAGRVLCLFTCDVPEWGVSEVASELHIAKSSAHALLTTLGDIGLVRRMSDGRYRLGWRILELNRTLVQSTDILGASRERLERLADRLQMTVHVAGLHDHDVVYLDKLPGSFCPEIAESGVGLTMPAHCTAVGKVLLASLGLPQINSIIEHHGLPRRTDRTITRPVTLREELARIQVRGYGYDLCETVSSVCCVAAPIHDARGTAQAAISLSMPPHRFDRHEKQLRSLVQAAATSIARDLRSEHTQLAGVG